MVMGIDDAITAGSRLIDDAINKIWPSPNERATAAATTMIAAATAAVEQLKAAQAVMLAEEQSNDPWTSRARPTFLYVIYVLILWSIPMGILTVFRPDSAKTFILGFHEWLAAIPEPYLELFGAGYLGYTGSRSWEKHSDTQLKLKGK